MNVLGIQLNSMFKDNLYCYCNSNSIMYIDDLGYSPRWWHLKQSIWHNHK